MSPASDIIYPLVDLRSVNFSLCIFIMATQLQRNYSKVLITIKMLLFFHIFYSNKKFAKNRLAGTTTSDKEDLNLKKGGVAASLMPKK